MLSEPTLLYTVSAWTFLRRYAIISLRINAAPTVRYAGVKSRRGKARSGKVSPDEWNTGCLMRPGPVHSQSPLIGEASMPNAIYSTSKSAVDARARRAARRCGLSARKSRWRLGTVDNRCGYQLLNNRNGIVGGERFDMSADDVLAYCSGDAKD